MKSNLCLLLTLVCVLISGCSAGMVGMYQGEIRLRPGAEERSKYPLLAARQILAAASGTTLELKSNGRFDRFSTNNKYSGEWWVENGKVAVRSTHQNGQPIGRALQSKGADAYYEIRDGEIIRGPWNSPDTNLEVVYVRR